MICATVKIIVAVVPVCMRLPFTSSHMSSFWTSSISSFVTIQGPVGPKVSQDLPLVHCPDSFPWKRRSETSLQTQ